MTVGGCNSDWIGCFHNHSLSQRSHLHTGATAPQTPTRDVAQHAQERAQLRASGQQRLVHGPARPRQGGQAATTTQESKQPVLGAGPHLLQALCAYQQWREVRVPTACFLCPKTRPRAISTALHRGEGVAHASDGHRRAMLPNVGALPPTASSSVGRAGGLC